MRSRPEWELTQPQRTVIDRLVGLPFQEKRSALIWGVQGSGKRTLVKAAAAKLELDIVEVSLSGSVEYVRSYIFGSRTAQGLLAEDAPKLILFSNLPLSARIE